MSSSSLWIKDSEQHQPGKETKKVDGSFNNATTHAEM